MALEELRFTWNGDFNALLPHLATSERPLELH
jgi:hypothetical protein